MPLDVPGKPLQNLDIDQIEPDVAAELLRQTEMRHEGRCCRGRRGGRVDPALIGVQTIRTEFGRPSSSMRLRT